MITSTEFLQNLNIEAKKYYDLSINDNIERSDIWKSNFDGLKYHINSNESPIDKISDILSTQFFSSGIFNKDVTKNEIVYCIEYLKDNYDLNIEDFLKENITESIFSNHDKLILFDNKHYISSDYFRHLFAILEIKKYCNLNIDDRLNIVELGSGIGALGRIFKLMFSNSKYFFIDIPESLYYAFLYIRLNFPDKKYKYITSNDKININEDIDFYFIPAKYIESIYNNKFDVFINECSMGEMNQKTLDSWFDFIQNKILVDYFYNFNRYYDDERSNAYLAYDNKWELLHEDINPKYNEIPNHPYGKYLSITHNFEKITKRIH